MIHDLTRMRVEGGTRIETGEKLRKPEPWMAKKENIIHGTEVQVRTCLPQGVKLC